MNLIGKSGQIQRVIQWKVRHLRASILAGQRLPVKERRWLFTGPPGVAKSHLAKQTALNLAGDPTDYPDFDSMERALQSNISIEYRNGSNVGLDLVRDWYRSSPYKPLFGDISVKVIDEVDAIGPAALNDVRTYLDELASHRVVIACTNKPVDQLQPQLQSRFQVFYFEVIPAPVIADHLIAQFHLDRATALSIARDCKGDVRCAEADAQTALDVSAAMAQAA